MQPCSCVDTTAVLHAQLHVTCAVVSFLLLLLLLLLLLMLLLLLLLLLLMLLLLQLPYITRAAIGRQG